MSDDIAREMWRAFKTKREPSGRISYDGRSARDWLAAHDARVAADARADERERIALAIEAYGAAHPMGPNSRPFAAVARKLPRAATDTEAGQ